MKHVGTRGNAKDIASQEQLTGLTASQIHAATSKATPADADELGYLNSAAGFDLVKMTWANLKAVLLAYFKGQFREKLTAARTYYVRTDGNDGNNGLSNTAGGAFLTIQKAVASVAALDGGVFDVTVQIADGTNDVGIGVELPSVVGGGNFLIRGNASNPENVIVRTSGSVLQTQACFWVAGVTGKWNIESLHLSSVASGQPVGLSASSGSILRFANIDFGSGFMFQLRGLDTGSLRATGGYKISAAGQYHFSVGQNSVIRLEGITITLTGTPAFSAAFGNASYGGVAVVSSVTFSGSATGARYSASANGVINTNGAGATYFPGDVAGTVATGGQYA
jgi:hypothetical protein